MSLATSATDLHRIASGALAPAVGDTSDYRIATALGRGFLAKNRAGRLALLIPLSAKPGTVGRRGGGFSLFPAPRISFLHEGRRWEQAAAVFECTDDTFLSAFIALIADVARRLEGLVESSWRDVLEWLDEWQAMLSGGTLSPEQQLGLWAELWIIDHAVDVDLLLTSWIGPDREASDFLIDAMGVEVKASRRAHIHQVSQRQVERPVGSLEAYLLSMWVGTDPVGGVSLADLVESILIKASDPAAFLKRIGQLGYSPLDRGLYSSRLVHLEEPKWFSSHDIPRVRAADPGVSMLRYTVSLDTGLCLSEEVASMLWDRLWNQAAPTVDARGEAR